MADINGKESTLSDSDIWRGTLAIFGFLLVIYLLTFSGQFTSVDELALYAKAESLVQDGNLETPQLAFAAYHNPVGDIEPGLPVVASPLYWLAQQFHRLNNIQTVMLLNPLVTAATAGVLFAISRLLGYSKVGSAFAALTFGLATLAWPYARTLYREPLVGFAWTLGLLGFVQWRYWGKSNWAIIGGIALVLTLAIKVTAIAAIPFIFIAVLARYYKRYTARRYIFIGIGVVVAVIILFQVVFTWRFGSAWDFLDLSGWSVEIAARRFYGQLLSPGKGLLFYMPVVLLTIPGLVLMWRRYRAVALAIALPMLATALAYSSYGSWFGGQSWGPRFLVPAMPLLILALAPLWDETSIRWLRPLYIGLVVVSIIIQLGVVTANWWSGYKPLYDSGPNPEDTAGLDPASIDISPPIVQLREWASENLDLLWLHTNREGSLEFSAVLFSLLLLILFATIVAWFVVKRGKVHHAWILLPPFLAVVIMLAFGPGATPDYTGLPADQGREISAWSANVDSEPYTLVTMSNEFHIYYYLGFLKGDFTHHWYSPNQTEGFEPILEMSKGDWVSLVLDRVHKDPALSGKELEWWLNEQLYRAESEWVGDYEEVRYANISSDYWNWREVNMQYGESFLISRYAVNREQFKPGDTVALQLEICRTGPMPAYHHLFTHLVSVSAQVNGHDGPVRFGGTVVLPWEEGDCLIERRAITIPSETPPGQYDLIVGFDTPDGFLSVEVESGQPADFALFPQVDIEP
jgi:hypothetical protein